MQNRNMIRTAALLGLTLMLSLGAAGCTVKWIADYDETVDKSVTALQRKLTTFFVDLESKLGTPEEAHANYVDTYKDIRVDISALELRVNAIPKNKITRGQIKLLKQNILKLENLHKTGLGQGIEGKKMVLMIIQNDFNTALAAILKLELAKKRGEKPKE